MNQVHDGVGPLEIRILRKGGKYAFEANQPVEWLGEPEKSGWVFEHVVTGPWRQTKEETERDYKDYLDARQTRRTENMKARREARQKELEKRWQKQNE